MHRIEVTLALLHCEKEGGKAQELLCGEALSYSMQGRRSALQRASYVAVSVNSSSANISWSEHQIGDWSVWFVFRER